MSHLSLVPALPAEECRCHRTAGRYWFQAAWRCKASDALIRFSPTIGWHHWAGHQIINPALTRTEQEAA